MACAALLAADVPHGGEPAVGEVIRELRRLRAEQGHVRVRGLESRDQVEQPARLDLHVRLEELAQAGLNDDGAAGKCGDIGTW